MRRFSNIYRCYYQRTVAMIITKTSTFTCIIIITIIISHYRTIPFPNTFHLSLSDSSILHPTLAKALIQPSVSVECSYIYCKCIFSLVFILYFTSFMYPYKPLHPNLYLLWFPLQFLGCHSAASFILYQQLIFNQHLSPAREHNKSICITYLYEYLRSVNCRWLSRWRPNMW